MMFYTMINMMAPMFFLMIPLMSATVTASSSFVGEKERSTIETLLLTPMTVRQIFRAKVEMCVRLSLLVTGISLALFAVTIVVGNFLLDMPFWFDWAWVVLIVLLAQLLQCLAWCSWCWFPAVPKAIWRPCRPPVMWCCR